ncbi:8791_t:CDS:2 [Funneliformis geosporum]|nr:8791_t:CDS:2 [Funneliformis geosporum]
MLEKTGILPNYEEHHDFKESNPEKNNLDQDQEINKITSELQNMIDTLNLQNPITAEKFIHIDDEISIRLLSDVVISNPEKNDIEEKKEEELAKINIITNKETLNNLQSIIQYFKNPPDNVLINYTELKVLKLKVHYNEL